MTDAKVEAARIAVERSRAQMLDTAKLLQRRLEPGKLTRDAWQSAKEKGADVVEDAVDAVRKRPYAAGGVVAAIALFIARDPIKDFIGRMVDGMTSDDAKTTTKRRTRNGKATQPSKPRSRPDPARAGD